jgi:hypothetical protein
MRIRQRNASHCHEIAKSCKPEHEPPLAAIWAKGSSSRGKVSAKAHRFKGSPVNM